MVLVYAVTLITICRYANGKEEEEDAETLLERYAFVAIFNSVALVILSLIIARKSKGGRSNLAKILVNRYASLGSSFLAFLSWLAVYNWVLHGTLFKKNEGKHKVHDNKLRNAFAITILALCAFCLLGSFHFRFLAKIKVAKDHVKHTGPGSFSIKDELFLLADGAFENLSSVVGAILASAWYAFHHLDHAVDLFLSVFTGVVVLAIMEYIERTLPLKSTLRYTLALIGRVCGDFVAWYAGFNSGGLMEAKLFKTPPNNRRVWMPLAAFAYWLFATLFIDFSWIHCCTCKTADGNPYGEGVKLLIVSGPSYVCGFITLNYLLERLSLYEGEEIPHYLLAAVWLLVVVSPAIIVAEQAAGLFMKEWGSPLVNKAILQLFEIFTRTLTFLLGRLLMTQLEQSGFDEIKEPWAWIILAIVFQVVAVLFEEFRIWFVPKMLKRQSARDLDPIEQGDMGHVESHADATMDGPNVTL